MDSGGRIGIVGGNGWIGGALARALVEARLAAPQDLTLSCRSAPPDWLPGAVWTHDNQALADSVDVVVLSARPQDWPEVRVTAPGKLVISVMAGVGLIEIAGTLGATRVVRSLPNAAIEVRRSYTPWFAAGATDEDRALVRRMFGACGVEDELAEEAHLDYLAGHSGTGPAYPSLLAAAMIKDAIARGLPEAVARRAAITLLVGAGRLYEKSGEAPEDVVASFVDYRGVTAAAIEAMRAGGFDAVVSTGLSAAIEKSRSMKEAAAKASRQEPGKEG